VVYVIHACFLDTVRITGGMVRDMSKLCIEDGFEYNLRRAASRFVDDFDKPEEAIEAIKEGHHTDVFLGYLWEIANGYTDVEQLIKNEAEDRAEK